MKLLRFLGFLEQNELPTQLDRIEKTHIRRFILYLQQEARTPHKNKPLSGATVQGYVRTLKSFFSWAVREGYSNANLMAGIPVPKAPVKVINSFTPEQITSLAAACQRENGTGHRNLAMLLVMLDCGLRVSELVDIDLGDVNLAEGYIRVRCGKGGKKRLVRFNGSFRRHYEGYIRWKQSIGEPIGPADPLILSSNTGGHMTTRALEKAFKRTAERAGFFAARQAIYSIAPVHWMRRRYICNINIFITRQRNGADMSIRHAEFRSKFFSRFFRP